MMKKFSTSRLVKSAIVLTTLFSGALAGAEEAAGPKTPLNQVLPGGEIQITEGIDVPAKTHLLYFADGKIFLKESDIPKKTAKMCNMVLARGTTHLGPVKGSKKAVPTITRFPKVFTDAQERRAVLTSDGKSAIRELNCITASEERPVPSVGDVLSALGETRSKASFEQFPKTTSAQDALRKMKEAQDVAKYIELMPNFRDRKPADKKHKPETPDYQLLPNFEPGKDGAVYQLLPNYDPNSKPLYQNL